MKKNEFDKLKNFWIKHLKLRDWGIDIRLVNPPKGCDDAGLNYVTPTLRESTIIIYLHPDTTDFDMEVTLVHELLHCYHSTMGLDEKSAAILSLEQGVEATAMLLVKMRHSPNIYCKKPKPKEPKPKKTEKV